MKIPFQKEKLALKDMDILLGLWPARVDYDGASRVDAALARKELAMSAHWSQYSWKICISEMCFPKNFWNDALPKKFWCHKSVAEGWISIIIVFGIRIPWFHDN